MLKKYSCAYSLDYLKCLRNKRFVRGHEIYICPLCFSLCGVYSVWLDRFSYYCGTSSVCGFYWIMRLLA